MVDFVTGEKEKWSGDGFSIVKPRFNRPEITWIISPKDQKWMSRRKMNLETMDIFWKKDFVDWKPNDEKVQSQKSRNETKTRNIRPPPLRLS